MCSPPKISEFVSGPSMPARPASETTFAIGVVFANGADADIPDRA
jgi:hypothetical protein